MAHGNGASSSTDIPETRPTPSPAHRLSAPRRGRRGWFQSQELARRRRTVMELVRRHRVLSLLRAGVRAGVGRHPVGLRARRAHRGPRRRRRRGRMVGTARHRRPADPVAGEAGSGTRWLRRPARRAGARGDAQRRRRRVRTNARLPHSLVRAALALGMHIVSPMGGRPWRSRILGMRSPSCSAPGHDSGRRPSSRWPSAAGTLRCSSWASSRPTRSASSRRWP